MREKKAREREWERREEERAWRWVFSAMGNLGRKKCAGGRVGERGERREKKRNEEKINK